ncbi:hypothetical protein [Iningainema tapete]|uniref:Uncharacterized protein n=1 Tax=Iningainema tapete BLCC-T55 TaxID=2748662 RepID=A0A8J6XRU9_9CYAN|nr:hypothetical protein [Iningainema tapete]MBD2778452.1 hypothetical protein [Iningainema tapete BLCC-T55]
MKSQETQTTTENNFSSDNAPETEYWNSNTRKDESVTQVQRDNVMLRKNLPDIRLIIGLTLVIGAFLFVAAIYYGIINP